MTFKQIKPYIDQKVILTDIDGQVFRGEITKTESEFDSASGKPEVEIRVKSHYIGIPIDEIKSIGFG